MDLVSASVVISKVSYVATGLLIFAWLWRHMGPPLAALLGSLIASFPYLVAIAAFSSPDAMTALLILGSFYLAFERDRPGWSASLLVVGVAARPDTVILLWLMAGYFIWSRAWIVAVPTIVGTAAWAYLSAGYSWSTHFYHSFVERLAYPAEFVSPLTLSDYAQIYLHEAQNVTNSSEGLILIVPLTLYLLYYHRQSHWCAPLTINGVFMLAHWLLYPKEKDRMLEGSYLLVLIVFAITVAPFLRRRSNG